MVFCEGPQGESHYVRDGCADEILLDMDMFECTQVRMALVFALSLHITVCL